LEVRAVLAVQVVLVGLLDLTHHHQSLVLALVWALALV
jgi:hypothetical protein